MSRGWLTAFLVSVATGCVFPVAAWGSPEPWEYRLASASVSLSTHQAGGHPDFSVSFQLHENAEGFPYAATRDVIVKLPAGLIGDPQAFPKCTTLEFGIAPSQNECPQDSQVGVVDITTEAPQEKTPYRNTFHGEPIFNMPAPSDGVARFGFFAGPYPVFFTARLDPVTNSVVGAAENTSATVALVGATTTLWGIPASPAHDQERLTPEEVFKGTAVEGGRKANIAETPFMTNPTGCGLGRSVSVTAVSYQEPESPSTMTAAFPEIAGCSAESFDPLPVLGLTTAQAVSGTGLDYEVSFPTIGLQFGNLLAGSEIKSDEVVLPEGMTINPSESVGLGACSEADLARERYDSLPNEGCPETSKIGSVTANTPLIDHNPTGSLYLARPYENPFGSLLALYMVLKIPDRGVMVKLSGRVILDPSTGRITTVFDDIPQLPVADFHLHFREGARATLITPYACGTYSAISNMTSWSDPTSVLQKQNTVAIESGPDHTACATSGTPPFSPGVIAGTLSGTAGSYSPFYLRITRGDGEQELTKFSTVMPAGVTGNLTGIPFCPEGAIQAAREKTGREELTSPACPAASEIGHTVVGAGVGGVLAKTPGKVYLAGAYRGSSLSIVSVTSAVAGPFDLGTVVIRFGLKVNPITAQVEVDSANSDPIPHIIQGIVVHVRDIRVYIDRQRFILNPTSCEQATITNAITGTGANIASPDDDQSVNVNSRFQATECASLGFKPSFTAATSGKTSRRQGASLHVKLVYPKAPQGTQANIRSVKVALPQQLPSRLSTLQHACTAAQFDSDPAGCPAASVVGQAVAHTPILPVPLVGPAYFVSHGGAKFPELVIVLQGYGITIQLHGETFINPRTSITSSTFRTVPDEPVTSFELTLPQGAGSALAANGDLCVTKLVMPTTFTAQDGAKFKQNTVIHPTGCPKRKPRKVKARGARGGHKGQKSGR